MSLRSLFCLFSEWPLKTGFTVLPPAHATWIQKAIKSNDDSDELVHKHCLTRAHTAHTDKREWKNMEIQICRLTG